MFFPLGVDPAHRGSKLISHMAANAFKGAQLMHQPRLMEPVCRVEAVMPPEVQDSFFGVLHRRRGKPINTEFEGKLYTVVAHVPVAESFALG